MRVQAKRSRPSQDIWLALSRSNRHGLQSELPLNNSKRDGLRPIYAFYKEQSVEMSWPLARIDNNHRSEHFLAPAGWLYPEFLQKGRRRGTPDAVLLQAILSNASLTALKIDSALKGSSKDIFDTRSFDRT
jgi:hypothetical protein